MFDHVASVIAEQFNTDVSKLSLETKFKEDLGADSLDLYGMVVSLEEEYPALGDIPQDDLLAFATIGDFVKYIEDKGLAAG